MQEINDVIYNRIAEYLISWIADNREVRGYITYGELAAPFGLNPHSRELSDILGYLSRTCNKCIMSDGQTLPLISSIVVNAKTKSPGHGYFNMLVSIEREDIDVKNEMERVLLQTDWRLLEERLGIQ